MTSTDDQNNGGILMLAMGHCLLQWATVETHLALLFHTLFGPDRETASLFWGRIRSFEAKLQILNDLVSLRLNNTQKRLWQSLFEHTMALYRKRNQVAHSTLVSGSNGAPALEPFSTPFSENARTLSKSDLDVFAKEFSELTSAILYFNLNETLASRQTECPEREPCLIDHLRKQGDRKREEQQHRALA